MKIKRTYRFIIALFSLLILLSSIQSSYAKYSTKAEADTTIAIARWNILVNNLDITSNNDFSSTIQPTFPGNEYIKTGIIAPLSEGYFDIEINHTNVDVSFKQTIELAYGTTNNISDLKIVGYSIGTDPQITNFTDEYKIIEDIMFTDTTKIKTYRIHLKWLDGTGETMDNVADTTATKTGIANIKVNTSFIQIAN